MTVFYYPELDNTQYDPQGPAARMPLPGYFKCNTCARFRKPEELTQLNTSPSIKMICRMCSAKE